VWLEQALTVVLAETYTPSINRFNFGLAAMLREQKHFFTYQSVDKLRFAVFDSVQCYGNLLIL
jgi:hypothetical protein